MMVLSPVSRKTFKYRLYPNRQQQERLQTTLNICRELYNAGLQERIESYQTTGKGTTFNSQSAQLPDIKTIREDVGKVFSQVLQDVLHRLDKTYASFFLRVKRHQKAGFPRFKGRYRYDSFTYPQAGFGLAGGKLQLSKIGNIKIKLHRELKGKIKTLTIKRENGNWYACFSCVVEPEPLPVLNNSVGIDVGLETFATLSNGDKIESPRLYRAAEKRLRRAQRKVARRHKGSHRRRKAVAILSQVHKDIFNQRNDFQHKEATRLVQKYGVIFVEDLNIKGLSRGMLAKSVHDASWGSFLDKLSYKAEHAGRRLVQVDPRGTSQRCICGADNRKRLPDREHVCIECGLVTSRDHASALEIQRLGLSLQASTIPELEYVA